MEAVLLIGIQGSGKSYFYKERFFNSHVRISLDLLKTRNREGRMLQVCLETEHPFVIDNTNATIEQRGRYIQPARQAGFGVIGYFFEPNIAESLKRNELRPDRERVPKVGIFAARKRLQRPSIGEGFDKLFRVNLMADGLFEIKDWIELSVMESRPPPKEHAS